MASSSHITNDAQGVPLATKSKLLETSASLTQVSFYFIFFSLRYCPGVHTDLRSVASK